MSTSTSTFTLPFHSAPCSSSCPLESQCLLLNVQTKSLQTMPSNTNPTYDKRGGTSSLRLNTTPTSSESHYVRIPCCTQIPWNHRPSDLLLNSHIYKECSNEDFALPNHANAACRSSGLTLTRLDDVKESGDSKDDARVVGNDEQVAEGAEGVMEVENINEVPSAHLHSVQLIAIPDDTIEVFTLPHAIHMDSSGLQWIPVPILPGQIGWYKAQSTGVQSSPVQSSPLD